MLLFVDAMTLNDIMERILSRCPTVTRESVLQKLDIERKRAGGLISDEALMRMIAVEFGCEIPKEGIATPELTFHHVISGLSDITVVGRVIGMFSPKPFRGNKNGRIASILLADKSGILRVVLWNDKARLVETGEFKVSDVVRFSHGYTREAYSGRVEVQVGEKGTFEVNPKEMKQKDFPFVDKFATKIHELQAVQRGSRVNLIGHAASVSSVSEFERPDASVGKVMRFVLSDNTAEVKVVVWNEKVDEIMQLVKESAQVELVNAKVKKALVDGFEVHVDGATYVGAHQNVVEFSQLASLDENSNSVSVVGWVASKPMLREVRTAQQQVLKISSFEIRDETGRMWVSAWRTHADSAKDLNVGDRIAIKDAYVKRGFGDQLELSTRKTSAIIKLQEKKS